MQIVLHNVDANGVVSVDGPDVAFVLQDDGQANVRMLLTLDGKTHLHFPKSGSKPQVKTLKAGNHECVLTIIAIDTGTLGRTFDSKVTIGGKLVATAKGSIAAAQPVDSGTRIFALDVVV